MRRCGVATRSRRWRSSRAMREAVVPTTPEAVAPTRTPARASAAAVRGGAARRAAGHGRAGLARLRQPHGRGRAPSRERPCSTWARAAASTCMLSARRVGETGRAYGLDMTDEMLELAQRNAEEAGVGNAVFLKGHMEEIPLPAGSVDVVISNCVINLSVDKQAVLSEIGRVLRPGGRLGSLRHRRGGQAVARRSCGAGQLLRLHRRRAVEGRVRGRARRGGARAMSASSSRTRSRTACTRQSSRRRSRKASQIPSGRLDTVLVTCRTGSRCSTIVVAWIVLSVVGGWLIGRGLGHRCAAAPTEVGPRPSIRVD